MVVKCLLTIPLIPGYYPSGGKDCFYNLEWSDLPVLHHTASDPSPHKDEVLLEIHITKLYLDPGNLPLVRRVLL